MSPSRHYKKFEWDRECVPWRPVVRMPAWEICRALFQVGSFVGMSDAELLERYVTGGGGIAEVAFAALVERHGPTVLRVCNDVLNDPHDAQDAAQVTFLVLAKRAGAIRRRNALASWLFGVARRVAARAKVEAARRRAHERRRAEMATREHDRRSRSPAMGEAVRNSSRRSTGCRSTTGVPSSCATWRV